MADFSVDDLFDAAVRLSVSERSIIVSFAADNLIRIKIPNTRSLADFLAVPHYSILRSFALMEQQDLVKREERVGIVTTGKGSRKMIGLICKKYRREMEEILGKEIFKELLHRTGID